MPMQKLFIMLAVMEVRPGSSDGEKVFLDDEKRLAFDAFRARQIFPPDMPVGQVEIRAELYRGGLFDKARIIFRENTVADYYFLGFEKIQKFWHTPHSHLDQLRAGWFEVGDVLRIYTADTGMLLANIETEWRRTVPLPLVVRSANIHPQAGLAVQ